MPEGNVNNSDNPVAPPSYAWGYEGENFRAKWHEKYGGKEEDGWRKATEQ